MPPVTSDVHFQLLTGRGRFGGSGPTAPPAPPAKPASPSELEPVFHPLLGALTARGKLLRLNHAKIQVLHITQWKNHRFLHVTSINVKKWHQRCTTYIFIHFDTLSSIVSTFIHFHPLPFTFIHIHFYPFSSAFIYFHPFSSISLIFIHFHQFHPFLSTLIYLHPLLHNIIPIT